MPDPIPTDDLYARLGVPRHADRPSIDRAWRALLKQHHPDIAGAMSLQLAKLINVAHDWLVDPERRARYDAAIRRREGRRATDGSQRRPPRAAPPRARPAATRAAPPPPDGLDEQFGASAPAVRSFVAQAARLTPDDIDRLSVAVEAPDVDELRDVVPPELWRRVELLDMRVAAVLPVRAHAEPVVVGAARSYARGLVLELFLWFYLADSEPMLEQLRRPWESAVGLPRYGPNTDGVRALLGRLARLTPGQARALEAAWAAIADPLPWPADAWEFDFSAFEVSAALARRDAAALVRPGAPADLRRAFGSTGHLETLRPIFAPRAFARFEPVWEAIGVAPTPLGRRAAPAAPRPTVRRARAPRP